MTGRRGGGERGGRYDQERPGSAGANSERLMSRTYSVVMVTGPLLPRGLRACTIATSSVFCISNSTKKRLPLLSTSDPSFSCHFTLFLSSRQI